MIASGLTSLGLSAIYAYYAVCANDLSYLGLLICPCLETAYICIWRKGIKFKWMSLSHLSLLVSILTLLWRLNVIKYDSEDIECRNRNITMQTTSECGNINLTICQSISVSLCMQTFINLFVGILAPQASTVKRNAKELIEILSTGADIIDFTEYSNKEEITKMFKGVDPVYGRKIS